MTFEDWFGSNRYLLKSEGKDRQIFTAEDLEDAWNAAISAALDKLYYEEYYYDNGNKWNDDCYSSTDPKSDIKKLLTA